MLHTGCYNKSVEKVGHMGGKMTSTSNPPRSHLAKKKKEDKKKPIKMNLPFYNPTTNSSVAHDAVFRRLCFASLVSNTSSPKLGGG